jgi:HEAT repeat protein
LISNMKNLIGVFCLGLVLPVIVFAQKPTISITDQTAKIVDSLFIRASSGTVQFRDLVEPSKKAIIDMGAVAVPQMLTKLKTSDARESQVVTDIFKGIGEPAVESLVNHITSQNNFERRLAIRSLGEIKSVRAVEPLTGMANHTDFRTRSETMAALGNIGSAQASLVVMKGLADPVELVATAAAVACGKIKEGIDPQVLIQSLSHKYYGVRYTACKSLSQLGEISVEPLVARLQSNPDDLAAGFAIEALGMIGPEETLAILEPMLKASDWSIRAYAVEAIGNLKDKKFKKILTETAKTEIHPFVKSRLKLALAKLESSNGS